MTSIILARYIRRRWYLRDGSRGARMDLLSMYDRVPYYPTDPNFEIIILIARDFMILILHMLDFENRKYTTFYFNGFISFQYSIPLS